MAVGRLPERLSVGASCGVVASVSVQDEVALNDGSAAVTTQPAQHPSR